MADINSLLGNLLKKMETVLKNSGIVTISGTIKEINTILDHKRCIFLTLDQYKKKVHINNKIYTNVSIVKDVKKHIIDHIKSVAASCPYNKVPRPIYVMISKKLEYDEKDSLVFGNCNKEIGAYSNGEISYSYIEKIDKDKQERIKVLMQNVSIRKMINILAMKWNNINLYMKILIKI